MHSLRLPLFFLLTSAALLRAQTEPATADSPPPVNKKPIELEKFVVSDSLDLAREDIVPSLGATSYEITAAQIATLSQGANAPFSQVILRAPGVAQDSSANGDLHIRGEHANLQYRINNVLLPEGISGFGLELDPRFVKSLQLVTGSLPAQYGFRTAGIVDIQTKGSGVSQGGEVSLYGGSFGTLRPSLELGGATRSSSYFLNASYDHNELGIENPTAGTRAIHDTTDQGKLFAYFSHNLDDASRISVMVSGSTSTFEVPNTPGLAAGESPNGSPWLPGTCDSTQ
ncbi:MAG: TonB-dependent receptor [Verrucomicrobia bacterium]|nr:TonB-dependent receptor [Verrucomicrobiota bacterium]